MTQTHMHIIFMKAAIETPVQIILNLPVFTLKLQKTFRGHFSMAINKIAVRCACFPCIDHGTGTPDDSHPVQIRPMILFFQPIHTVKKKTFSFFDPAMSLIILYRIALFFC